MIVSGHYPPVVRGVNKRGMKRAGLNEEQQEKVFEAHRRLYRQGGALLENAQAMIDEGGLDENVQAIVDSIINSGKHQYGRYLETFR
jgi:acyl-[acyl carrier protein]--UDP-N-acetylglucosamine O-acyltransferase